MIKRILLASLLASTSLAASAACTLEKVAQLPVTVENGQILLPAVIKDQKVKLVFDTAYPANAMPSNAAARLGLPVTNFAEPQMTGGRPEGTDAPLTGLLSPDAGGLAEVNDLNLGGLMMKGARFVSYHSSDNFGPDVVGTLGANLWHGFDIEIDLAHNMVTLSHAKDCGNQDIAPWGQAYNMLDMVPSGALTSFDVKINGHTMSAILDSGSAHSSMTERAAGWASLKHLDGAGSTDDALPPGILGADLPALIRFSHGFGLISTSPNVQGVSLPDLGMNNPRSYWPAKVDKLELDHEVVSSMNMRVVPLERVMAKETGTRTPRNILSYDVLLGVDFLRSHKVLIANSQRRMYFLYTGDTAFTKQ